MTAHQIARFRHWHPPLVEFRLWPETKRQHFTVLVFRTEHHLHDYLRIVRPEIPRKNVLAYLNPSDGRGPYLGEVLLVKRYVDRLTVEHELFHAVAWYAQRRRIGEANRMKWRHAAHERLAECLGNLAKQFWQQWESVPQET